MYLSKEVGGPVPLDVANEMQRLMQKESDQTNGDSDHTHHKPAVPVQPVTIKRVQ